MIWTVVQLFLISTEWGPQMNSTCLFDLDLIFVFQSSLQSNSTKTAHAANIAIKKKIYYFQILELQLPFTIERKHEQVEHYSE